MNPSRDARPPVFVMNPYHTGVGIARSLHGLGVQVCALTAEAGVPGARSRFFDRIYRAPSSRDEPEALCAWLRALPDRSPSRPVLFPTRDFDVLFLQRYREELLPLYRLPEADARATDVFLDKLETARLAERAGVSTPATISCSSEEELERRVADLGLPVVIKPRCAYQWRGRGAWEQVGARKAILVETAAELREAYRQVATVSPEVLVQTYVRGEDQDIVTFCCYMGPDGEALGWFGARKVRQSPRLFGTGCVVELLDVPELVAPSLRLLRAAGYAGIAEIEYKIDPVAREFFLLEINPRHWDQHELGLLAGVNISRIAYERALGNRPEIRRPDYAGGGRWVAEGDLAWAILQDLRQTRAPGAALREWRASLGARRVFSIARFDDPIPSVVLWSRMLGTIGRAVLRRRRRGGAGPSGHAPDLETNPARVPVAAPLPASHRSGD